MERAIESSAEVLARAALAEDESGLFSTESEIELTETVRMQHSEATASMLQCLKAMGVRLALDDFGTGFSSLSYLRRFPIDTLKIDRSFVQEITSNLSDAPIS